MRRLLAAGFGILASLSPGLAQMPQPRPFPLSPSNPLSPSSPFPPSSPLSPTSPLPPSSPLPQSRPLPPVRNPLPGRPVAPPAQTPPLSQIPGPVLPAAPATIPGPLAPQPAVLTPPPPGALPDRNLTPQEPVEVKLPHAENKISIDVGSITLRRVRGGWQAWMGTKLLRDFGNDEVGARDFVRIFRELRPTEWITIGSRRPIVEYGLTNGRPVGSKAFPQLVMPIDMKTVRVEAVRGVWCLRDDYNLLFNFELDKSDADQAAAVIRKYGFNRIGMIGGNPAMPAMTYFYSAIEIDDPALRRPPDRYTLAAQEQALTRTGILIPGVGYFGISMKIDPRKVEVRKEGYEWVVAHGADVIARFGAAEYTAHEALRIIQDGRFTEFCTAGSGGLTFFLANGEAPTRVPYSAHGRQFDLSGLKVHQFGSRWAVTENGRFLFEAGSRDEGDKLIQLLKHFRFDQICQVGSPGAGLKFLARSR